MTCEIMDPNVDTPPELAGLREVATPRNPTPWLPAGCKITGYALMRDGSPSPRVRCGSREKWVTSNNPAALHRWAQQDLRQQEGLGDFGLLPLFLLAGGATVGATVTSWLSRSEWGTEEYNLWMRKMNDTIGGGVPGKTGGWDALGWQTGCWQRFPQKRKQWLSFWTRFSKFYRENPAFTDEFFVPDSEERAARQLMFELGQWGEWLNKTCGAPTTSDLTVAPPPPLPPGAAKWDTFIKLGAGASALLALLLLAKTGRDLASKRA